MQISERLFSLRQKSGQSLQQVADAIGVSKAHVWELEKGRSTNPSFDLVQKLAGHFGVSVEVLVGQAEEPTSDVLQIDRINRKLSELTPRDRDLIEAMIRSMQLTPADGS